MSHDTLLKLSGRLFRSSALICMFTGVLTMTFATPATIKQAARDSKIYEAASTYTKSAASDVNINPVVKAGLDNAATTSFTPAFLQSSSEQLIDGTYHWLDGSAAKPDFRIDATSVVEQFLGKVGDSTASYTKNLPACPAGTPLPNLNGTDLKNLTCLPRGITIPNVREETINRLRASNAFLANPILTADSLSTLTQGQSKDTTSNLNGTNNTPAATSKEPPVYEKFSQLPTYFQIARMLPWIFGAISLLAAIWMFALYRNAGKAIYRLSRSLLWVSLPVALFTALGHYVFNMAANQGGGIAQAVDGTFQQYSVAFVRSIENSLAHNLLLVSGSLAAVSGLITLVIFFIHRSVKHESDHGYAAATSKSAANKAASLTDSTPETAVTDPAGDPLKSAIERYTATSGMSDSERPTPGNAVHPSSLFPTNSNDFLSDDIVNKPQPITPAPAPKVAPQPTQNPQLAPTTKPIPTQAVPPVMQDITPAAPKSTVLVGPAPTVTSTFEDYPGHNGPDDELKKKPL